MSLEIPLYGDNPENDEYQTCSRNLGFDIHVDTK